MRKRKVAATKRVRRTPEEARATILDAAERVFARYVPDEVGLKEVAEAARVSLALVHHYFGSYDALVEATLERRIEGVRARIMAKLVDVAFAPEGDPMLLRALVELVSEPVTLRLWLWSSLRGRAKPADLFAARAQGLARIVDGIEKRIDAAGAPPPPRDALEFSVLAAIGMAVGLATLGPAMHAALGREGAFDQLALLDETKLMLRSYLIARRRGA